MKYRIDKRRTGKLERKVVSGLALAILLISTFMLAFQLQQAASQGTNVNWTPITQGSATVTSSNGIYSFYTDANQADYSILDTPMPSSASSGYTVSYDAQGLQVGGALGFFASADPQVTFGSTNAVALEMTTSGVQGKGFQIDRETTDTIGQEGITGTAGGWAWSAFAYPQPNTWYHVVITVNSQPFSFSAIVYYTNGTVMGSASVNDSVLSYSQLRSLGFECWGGPCTYQMSNFTLTTSVTAIPTPSPSPTPSPLPKPTLSVSCISSTSYNSFNVEINGTLAFNGPGISGVPILLSYSVNGGASWQSLTTVNTDSIGNFLAQWLPSASGNYLLNATYAGSATYSSVSTIVNLAVMPFAAPSATDVFSVASNATVTNLAFNSTTNELSFTVSGPSGTTGYADVCIAKSLVSDASAITAYKDGNVIGFTVTSTADSWILHFTFGLSTHQITIYLASKTVVAATSLNLKSWLWLILVAVVVVVAVAAIMTWFRRNKIRVVWNKT